MKWFFTISFNLAVAVYRFKANYDFEMNFEDE